MFIKDFLKKVDLDKSGVSYFYKNTTDEKPVEIEIINSNKNGECEIIRLTQINERIDYAGFFTTINTIWIKTPTRFVQIGVWLKELEK
jgi:hypothetical protein